MIQTLCCPRCCEPVLEGARYCDLCGASLCSAPRATQANPATWREIAGLLAGLAGTIPVLLVTLADPDWSTAAAGVLMVFAAGRLRWLLTRDHSGPDSATILPLATPMAAVRDATTSALPTFARITSPLDGEP